MRIVNLTPHSLNIFVDRGESAIAIRPSGTVARIATVSRCLGNIMEEGGDLIHVYETAFGEVVDLPDPEKGTVFAVPRIVLEAVRTVRPDVYAPGELVRGEDGQPVGCKGLSR